MQHSSVPILRPAFKVSRDLKAPSTPEPTEKTVTAASNANTGSPKSTSEDGRRSTSPLSTTTASSASEGSLSVGAEAGIGLGVAVAALAMITALIFFFWQRKQKAKRAHAGCWDSPQETSYQYGSPAFPAGRFGGEMEGTPPSAELRGSASGNPRPKCTSPRLRHLLLIECVWLLSFVS